MHGQEEAVVKGEMVVGCWFNPCDYPPDGPLLERVLQELDAWDEPAANHLRAEWDEVVDQDGVTFRVEMDDTLVGVVMDDLINDAVALLNDHAPEGYWVGFGDDANSFGCWEEEG